MRFFVLELSQDEVILLLFFLNRITNSLKSNDFCLLNKTNNLICKHYQCSLDVCSKDKRSCDQLKNLFKNNQNNNFYFLERIKIFSYIYFFIINSCQQKCHLLLPTIAFAIVFFAMSQNEAAAPRGKNPS